MSIRLMLLCAAVCGSTLFFNACATKEAVPPQPEKKSTPVPVKAEKKQAPLPRKAEKKDVLVPVAPVNGAQVSLLNAGQKAFLNMPRAERTAFFADPAKRKQLKKNGYYPEPVRLKWNWNGKNNPEFTVTVTREQDKTPVFSVKTKETEAAVWNLEIARNYTWTVSADGKTASATFKTEDQAPRLLRIKGVPNVRDLGGRIGLDGKRVKQSLVYRTAGLNDNASEVKYTRDELYGKYGEALKEKEKNLLAQIGNLREFQKKPASLNLVSIKLSPEWKVFLMKGSITAPPEIPSAIPAEIQRQETDHCQTGCERQVHLPQENGRTRNLHAGIQRPRRRLGCNRLRCRLVLEHQHQRQTRIRPRQSRQRRSPDFGGKLSVPHPRQRGQKRPCRNGLHRRGFLDLVLL